MFKRPKMPRETTYTAARANFAKLCDEVTADRKVIIVNRRGAEDVALIAASELSSLLETAHLLRSPKNAQRLLKALNRAVERKGKVESVDQLRREIGIETA
jgi:antitoxin YefM